MNTLIINAFRMGCRKYRLHRVYGWRVGKLYNIYIISILSDKIVSHIWMGSGQHIKGMGCKMENRN